MLACRDFSKDGGEEYFVTDEPLANAQEPGVRGFAAEEGGSFWMGRVMVRVL